VRKEVSIPHWVPLIGSEEETELPLREFIYLDEVSVISLLASLTREITESRTISETNEKQTSWKLTLKSVISKIPILGRITRETHRIKRDTEEVNRKSEIQSKFDELYSKTSNNLELAAGEEGVEIPVSNLNEGGIVELQVDFSAHELFHFYKAYQYLFDVFESQTDDYSQEEEEIIELMGSLFGNQIPVVGKAVNYRVVDGQICSIDMIDEEDAEELQIVGTLDPDILWQDASQFLYDENQFTVYARVPKTHLQKDWDPVKLTRVIRSINKPIGDQLSQMIEFGLTQAKQELDEGDFDTESDTDHRVGKLVGDYYNHIEEEYMEDGNTIDGERRSWLLEKAYSTSLTSTDSSDVEIGLEVLKNLTDLLEDEEGLELDRDQLSDYRMKLISRQNNEDSDIQTNSEGGNYLEVNFVAVYW